MQALLHFRKFRKGCIKVIAHNGHRYDDIFLLKKIIQLFPYDYQLAGSPSEIHLLRFFEIFDFADSMELIPGSLLSLGKEF